MMRFLLTFTALTLLTLAAQAERRALLIGNASYGKGAELDNPVNDVVDIASALRGLDFEVTVETDLDVAGMEKAILSFARDLSVGDTAFFYFAGHGLEIAGANYLVPIHASLASAQLAKYSCVEANYVLDELDGSGAEVKVMVLDCCRDNPLKEGWSRSLDKGLNEMKSSSGALIAFATAAGEAAADGKGKRNSPYSAALQGVLKERPEAGMELVDAFRLASRRVKAQTGQEPWLNFQGSMYYYLVEPSEAFLSREAEVRRLREALEAFQNAEASTNNTASADSGSAEELRRLRKELEDLRNGGAEKAVDEPKIDVSRGHTNGLGMRFVPVPGTDVMFSVWETRRKDYEAYSRSASKVDDSWRNVEWKGEPVGHGSDHPVVRVSWEDAQGFCDWLTEKERSEGRLGIGDRYRLPTDREWSVAVGLPYESGNTPADRDEKNQDHFPWGGDYPPSNGAGNYSDSVAGDTFGLSVIDSLDDGQATTAPVGSYRANPNGLYDLGGNVWEWCEDWYDNDKDGRVLRGGSWSYDYRDYLLSSYRYYYTPTYRISDFGFRCVLAVGGSSGRLASEE